DGCTDSADSGCGATETNCVDGLDNDCDGNPDCGDFDCYGETNCMDCGDRSNCAACIADGMCDWCIGGSWGTRCVDSCKTGFFSNCWGGSCYKNSCP
ncbi:hypothetical protein JXB31_04120, partial [Candidatus Woesearchaeota archaeon]|nr:hypothetical protein [Candidatus Woesearchaeota archaeon]